MRSWRRRLLAGLALVALVSGGGWYALFVRKPANPAAMPRWVTRAVSRQVGPGRRAIQVEKLAGGEKPLWAVLAAHWRVWPGRAGHVRLFLSRIPVVSHLVRLTEADGFDFVKISDARLFVFAEGSFGCRKVAGSAPVGGDRFPDDVSEANLTVSDLTGDGVPEMAIEEIVHGGSWVPSHLGVLALQGGHLVSILSVDSSMPVDIRDVDGDGRQEVANVFEIGQGMCHAEQPRWSDIYAYRGDHFVKANEDFPKEFAHWPAELRSVLAKYPGDPDILLYLGIAEEIAGHPKAATAAYAAAEREYAAWAAGETNADFRARYENGRKDAERRREAIQARLAGTAHRPRATDD